MTQKGRFDVNVFSRSPLGPLNQLLTVLQPLQGMALLGEQLRYVY